MNVFCLTTMLVLATVPLVACSSAAPGTGETEPASTAPVPTAPAGTVSTPATSAPVEFTPGMIAPTKSLCPAVAPKAGSECSEAGLICSWGEDPRFGCRTIQSCISGQWASVGDSCSSREPLCPRASPASATAGPAPCGEADLGITCVYGEQAYTCAPCEGYLCRNESFWQTTVLTSVCPTTLPNFGEPCGAPSGTVCNYNQCAKSESAVYGASLSCTSGAWTQSPDIVCF
jgi:hypothetical protein